MGLVRVSVTLEIGWLVLLEGLPLNLALQSLAVANKLEPVSHTKVYSPRITLGVFDHVWAKKEGREGDFLRQFLARLNANA